jgi:tryptophan 2,3-dioxygenase
MVESVIEWRVPYCRRHVDCVEGVRMGAVGCGGARGVGVR